MGFDRRLLDAKYYEIYHFCNVIQTMLFSRFDYLRELEGFYCDDNFLAFFEPYPKNSALHKFIEFVVHGIMYDETCSADIAAQQNADKSYPAIPIEYLPDFRALPINEALAHYAIEHETFDDWLKSQGKSFDTASQDDAFEYFGELQWTEPMEKFFERVVAEVFFVLFGNRRLLQIFNMMLAGIVGSKQIADIPDDFASHMRKDGVLKRVATPSWVRKAVFYRDRGLCVLCQRDITGLVSIDNMKNFDHIVPLSKGGLNDVTNIQLLCEQCNNQKRHWNCETSDVYEAWY